MSVQLLRKISTRTVYGSRSEVLELVFSDKTREHTLYRVMGIATGTRKGGGEDAAPNQAKPGAKPRESYGPWEALLGDFRAINMKTEERFTSGVCFLPQYVTDMISGKIAAHAEDGDGVGIKFAFDVTAKFDEDSATSYVYGVRPLMPEAPDDALASLEAQISAMISGPSATPSTPAPAAKEPVAKEGAKK